MFRLAAAVLAAILLPGAALAHATQRAVLNTLPTTPYVLAAGVAVAVSALFVAIAPRIPAPGSMV
ncbi:MAG: hypothetical protein KDD81_01090, partial [Rhodobacteraceae bacterium]|nr:hypothetical protein [Paracoccaceae bacterium]MCB2121349.1 hypothetical protein [Paracoccaceae bacterium]MCB2131567.1 hypothetical protein [Paracoccaceae bacterium]MCB2139025.1 hypothetical protein [Paracoccaceae bacterium]